MLTCTVCDSDTAGHFLNVYDDRYGYPGQFHLLRCSSCGHRYLDCRMSPEQLSELYTNFYPRSSLNQRDYKPYHEAAGIKAWLDGAYRSAFRWVPGNVRVLDIGCGFGETLGYHAARGCDVYGVEVDENIRRVAERYGFKVHVGLFDPDVYEPDYFDYVTMDQVIEHMGNPVETLKGIARVLKPGGIAILSTPNADGWGTKRFGNRWLHWHAPYHLQHFSVRSMRVAAEKAGLSVKQHKVITSSDWLYWQWIHLLTYPKPGNPSVFWSPTGKLHLYQKMPKIVLTLLHRLKITHIITRILDRLQIGDNVLYFLVKPY